MPEASPELRAEMKRRFGSIDTHGPMKFLENAGYTLSRAWEWSKPGITDLKQMTRDEFECLLFLIHEWDFGGLATVPLTTGDDIDDALAAQRLEDQP